MFTFPFSVYGPKPLLDALNAFKEWFLTLALPAQILTSALIILGIIAICYIIYGTLWLTYQIVKAAIVLVIIQIYLSIVAIILIITLISDYRNLGNQWSKVSHNIQRIISKAYPSENGQVTARPLQVDNMIHSKNNNRPTNATQGPVVIIRQNQKPQYEIRTPVKNKVDEYKDPGLPLPESRYIHENQSGSLSEDTLGSSFCPNCGAKFSSKMSSILKEKTFTFCEICGKKFMERNLSIESSA
ncbi:MAG: hypothetical protein GY870_14690 [archaeon]|nr:hypothetical protein [archaeon]